MGERLQQIGKAFKEANPKAPERTVFSVTSEGETFTITAPYHLGFRAPSQHLVNGIDKYIDGIQNPGRKKEINKIAAEQLLQFKNHEIEDKKPGGDAHNRWEKLVLMLGGGLATYITLKSLGISPILLTIPSGGFAIAKMVGERLAPKRREKNLNAAISKYALASEDQELIRIVEEDKKAKVREKKEAKRRDQTFVTFKHGEWDVTLGGPRILGFKRSVRSLVRQVDKYISKIEDPHERINIFLDVLRQLPYFGEDERERKKRIVEISQAEGMTPMEKMKQIQRITSEKIGYAEDRKQVENRQIIARPLNILTSGGITELLFSGNLIAFYALYPIIPYTQSAIEMFVAPRVRAKKFHRAADMFVQRIDEALGQIKEPEEREVALQSVLGQLQQLGLIQLPEIGTVAEEEERAVREEPKLGAIPTTKVKVH